MPTNDLKAENVLPSDGGSPERKKLSQSTIDQAHLDRYGADSLVTSDEALGTHAHETWLIKRDSQPHLSRHLEAEEQVGADAETIRAHEHAVLNRLSNGRFHSTWTNSDKARLHIKAAQSMIPPIPIDRYKIIGTVKVGDAKHKKFTTTVSPKFGEEITRKIVDKNLKNNYPYSDIGNAKLLMPKKETPLDIAREDLEAATLKIQQIDPMPKNQGYQIILVRSYDSDGKPDIIGSQREDLTSDPTVTNQSIHIFSKGKWQTGYPDTSDWD
jgi:hypothetical protein